MKHAVSDMAFETSWRNKSVREVILEVKASLVDVKNLQISPQIFSENCTHPLIAKDFVHTFRILDSRMIPDCSQHWNAH